MAQPVKPQAPTGQAASGPTGSSSFLLFLLPRPLSFLDRLAADSTRRGSCLGRSPALTIELLLLLPALLLLPLSLLLLPLCAPTAALPLPLLLLLLLPW